MRTGSFEENLVRIALFVFLIVLCTSCANNLQQTDKYRYAANSWVGGSIISMVEAWGTPNIGYMPAKDGEPGVAGWSVLGGSSMQDNNFSCKTLAYFDTAGVVTSIDVEHSTSCQRPYRDKLDLMTRNTDD